VTAAHRAEDRMETSPPQIQGLLETCIYAADLSAAEQFYVRVVGLTVYARVPDRHVFFRCGESMFLVFNPAATQAGMRDGSGQMRMQHGAIGAGHVAFQVDESTLAAWRRQLAAHGVTIEAELTWPGGGRSIYFRDPAGNSVELATATVWQ
jgi:catechol 2,3-dioxygenase-like lactoylglutathione lyase family enzyme